MFSFLLEPHRVFATRTLVPPLLWWSGLVCDVAQRELILRAKPASLSAPTRCDRSLGFVSLVPVQEEAGHLLVHQEGDAAGRSHPDQVWHHAFVEAQRTLVPTQRRQDKSSENCKRNINSILEITWSPFGRKVLYINKISTLMNSCVCCFF